MKRLSILVGVGIYVLAMSVVAAQQAPAQGQGQGRQGGAPGAPAAGGGRGQAPPTNLQVMPRDTSAQQVGALMQQIAAGLGVACNYCHVTAQDAPAAPAGRGDGARAGGDGAAAADGRGGRAGGRGGPAPMNDFASDAKIPKRTARTMMLMTRDINAKLNAELGKPAAEVTQVGCVTCHRGVPIPKQLVDIVMERSTSENAAAAVTQYRELRTQFYGAAAYDFSDFTLFTAAQRALAAMPARPDDALAFLQANVEFNPMSARSFQQMSVAYQRKMDMPNAIAMMEKAVSLAPMNMQFQNQLNQLRMQQ